MASNFKNIGSTGLTRFGGIVCEEWLNELKGIKGIRTYKEMRDNDDVVGAFLFAVEMLLRQVKFRIEKQGDTEQDEEAEKFIEECLSDMDETWSEIMSSILSMLPFGWSLLEVTLKRRKDGRIGWKSWGHRSQETLNNWVFKDDNTTEAFEQLAPPNYRIVSIPMDKCLHFRLWSLKDNPEGRSILRNAYRSWYFKKNIETLEGIGMERDLAGLPVMWIPAEIITGDDADSVAAFAEYKKMISNIRRDEQEGVIMPLEYDDNGNKMYDFALMSTGSKRQFDTNQIINRHSQKIAMTVLADFLMLGHNSVGSFALSSDKTSLFATALGAILNSISDVINKDAIPKLIKANDFNIIKAPKFIFSDLETPDLDILGNYIQKISSSGMSLFPNDDLEEALMQSANLPVKKKTDMTDTKTEELQQDNEDIKIENESNAHSQTDVQKALSNMENDREYFNKTMEELLNTIKEE